MLQPQISITKDDPVVIGAAVDQLSQTSFGVKQSNLLPPPEMATCNSHVLPETRHETPLDL